MDRVTGTGQNQQRTKRLASVPKKPKERNRLSSVATAIRLLKAFSEEEEELGVSALAHKLGVAKSTVHRLAVTLVSEGLLEQDPRTDRYRLGIGLFGLGTLVRRRMNLSNEARPYLFDLRSQTGETILLGIPAETEVMYVYNLESPQALRMRSDIGVRRPAHCTAVGRAIFAYAPETIVDRVLAGSLALRTPKTVTDKAALRAIFAGVRERGYAIEDEECEPGIRCIAAPVRGADVTVEEEANIISVPSRALAKASDGCRHKFDRAFMQILVERLSLANLRLSGV